MKRHKPTILFLSWVSAFFSPNAASAVDLAEAHEDEAWAVHGQATLVEQYHPAFKSPYRGHNSLDPGVLGQRISSLLNFLRPHHVVPGTRLPPAVAVGAAGREGDGNSGHS